MLHRRGYIHALLRRPLFWPGIITLILTLAFASAFSPAARGFTQDSPPATPTFMPVPPTPTAAPATNTPTPLPPTATSLAPAPTQTPTKPTPPPTTPPAHSATIIPQPTATFVAPAPPPQLTPPAIIEPIVTLTQPITVTATPGPSDNLVNLIDTFVLYSFYFLLGLGLIAFIVLAIFLYYLHRRAQELSEQSGRGEHQM